MLGPQHERIVNMTITEGNHATSKSLLQKYSSDHLTWVSGLQPTPSKTIDMMRTTFGGSTQVSPSPMVQVKSFNEKRLEQDNQNQRQISKYQVVKYYLSNLYSL